MIHPTAIVHPSAKLAPSVSIGAYAIVEADVKIGADTRVWPHAYISQHTTLGERCQVHPFAVIGHFPQDYKYDGTPSYTVIGNDVILREHVEVHRGTHPGSSTTIGDRVFLMSNAHVAHNCRVDADAILCSGVLLGGHVHIASRAFLGGGTGIHQFTRVGELAFTGGNSSINGDIPPFMRVDRECGIVGPNVVGLRRNGYSDAERQEVRDAFKILYHSRQSRSAAIEQLATRVKLRTGEQILAFVRALESRALMHSFRTSRRSDPEASD